MDEQQKNDFAARLERIQAQKAAQDEYTPLDEDDGRAPTGGPDLPPRASSGIGVVRVGLILMTVLAILGFGALYLLEMSDEDERIATAPAPAAPAPQAAAPRETDPLLAFAVPRRAEQTGRRIATERGWEHPFGSVATPDGAEVRVEDIADGFDAATPDRVPLEVVTFAANSECTLKRPAEGDIIRNVRIDHATVETDIHAFSNADMAGAVLAHTNAALYKPKSHEYGATAKGRLNRVDVFVTDTSGPVYLVLQAFGGNTLWNVHRGQGVRIAHVAMIGNASGIALPDDVSFEALRIRDFVTNFEFGSNDAPRPCMIAPYRLPKPHWEAQQKAANGNMLYSNKMYTFNAGHRAFAAWYRDTLGADPEAGLTEAEGAGHALVGPVPPALLTYRSLAGRTAYVTEADNLLVGDDSVGAAHRELLLAAAGGDTAAITPPVRRASE